MRTNSGTVLMERQQKQLQQFARTAKGACEFRAATGILMRGDGKSSAEVAKGLGVTKKQVFMWCRKFREQGVGGLLAKKQTGRKPTKKNEAKKLIKEMLKKDPQMFGYLKGRWALRDISRELKKEGVDLHYTGVRRALLDLGIVFKQPKLRAPGSLKKNYRKRAEIRRYKRVSSALLKKGSCCVRGREVGRPSA